MKLLFDQNLSHRLVAQLAAGPNQALFTCRVRRPGTEYNSA